VIAQGQMAIGIDIENTGPIGYVLTRRFFCRLRETDREHKAIVHEIIVLRKMIEDN